MKVRRSLISNKLTKVGKYDLSSFYDLMCGASQIMKI